MPNPLQALSIGVIVLFIVISVPVVVDSTDGVSEHALLLDEGKTERVDKGLEVTAVNIEQETGSEPANATIRVRDVETLNSSTKVVGDNTTVNFSLSGGTVSVLVHSITDSTPETVRADVEVPNTYGWSPGARTVANNLGIIVVVGGFIVVLMLLASVIN